MNIANVTELKLHFNALLACCHYFRQRCKNKTGYFLENYFFSKFRKKNQSTYKIVELFFLQGQDQMVHKNKRNFFSHKLCQNIDKINGLSSNWQGFKFGFFNTIIILNNPSYYLCTQRRSVCRQDSQCMDCRYLYRRRKTQNIGTEGYPVVFVLQSPVYTQICLDMKLRNSVNKQRYINVYDVFICSIHQ